MFTVTRNVMPTPSVLSKVPQRRGLFSSLYDAIGELSPGDWLKVDGLSESQARNLKASFAKRDKSKFAEKLQLLGQKMETKGWRINSIVQTTPEVRKGSAILWVTVELDR
jgi:hypothetical protein